MKAVAIELVLIAVLLVIVSAAYADDFTPDGSRPMSPEHRALRDPQGHLDEKLRKAYSAKGYCAGHVKEVLVYPQGEIVIACYPAKLSKGTVISHG